MFLYLENFQLINSNIHFENSDLSAPFIPAPDGIKLLMSEHPERDFSMVRRVVILSLPRVQVSMLSDYTTEVELTGNVYTPAPTKRRISRPVFEDVFLVTTATEVCCKSHIYGHIMVHLIAHLMMLCGIIRVSLCVCQCTLATYRGQELYACF